MWAAREFTPQIPHLARLDELGTSHFLLPLAVNSVTATWKIIWPRRDRIARLVRAWVCALTFVRTRLPVADSY
jgi:hypothetical protein